MSRTWKRGLAPCFLALASLMAGGPATAKKPAPAPAAKTAPAKAEAADRAAAPAPASAGSARETVQRESRIEFDERLVQGQTAAGAIYLFQRGESEFRSMIKLPESFRDRTVRQLLPPSSR